MEWLHSAPNSFLPVHVHLLGTCIWPLVLAICIGTFAGTCMVHVFEACRGVEVAGRTFDRKVDCSSPNINIVGCCQEGHPDIKWLTAPAKSPAMQAPSNPQ